MICQIQIIFHQLPYKFTGTGSVCQHMKDLKIDSLFVISHFKKQISLITDIKAATRLLILFSYNRSFITLFQIMPEQSLSQHRQKNRIFFQCPVYRLLQDLLLYILFQFTVKPEYTGIPFTARRRKKLRCIVQPSPVLYICLRHFLFPLQKMIDIFKTFLYMQTPDSQCKISVKCILDPVYFHPVTCLCKTSSIRFSLIPERIKF